MKAKRLTALLLLVVTLIGMLPGAALAANTPEEALGEIRIYNGGEQLAYLAVNGRVQKLNYVYFEHNSPTGIKQIPAYCVNPTTDGVPQVVGTGQSIEYLAQNQATDPKIVGIVGNGYPHRSLEELGLDNIQQAYYATKIALWCYLVPTWSIDKVTIAPGLSEHEQQIAQRLLAAATDIYNRGSGWTDVLIPGLTVSPDQQEAYEVQINGETYLQQVYTVKSGTWVDGLEISIWFDSEDVPDGMKIVGMNNQEIEKIPVESSGYQGQFKVICPKDSITGNTSVKFLLEGNVNQYAAFYAVCQETGTYGQLQNYIADTDPVLLRWSNALFNYSPDGTPPTPGDGEYSLKIVKTETGTGTRLEGALFEVKDPDGAPVGTFSTNAQGEIIIPLERGGLYTITEVQPPKGHLMAKNPVQQVQVEKDTVATVSYENEPYGNLRVEKVDADTGDTLPGAKVQIKHIETGATYTQITNEAGVAIFNELKPGAYEIVELKAPDGWIKDGQTYTVNVPGQDTVTFTLKNSAKLGLRVIKYDRQTHETLPDITFKIYKDNQLIGTYETDRLGEILLTDLEPGTYRVEEVESDDEHVVDTMPQEIELTEGCGILELVFFNDRKPGLHLVKIDSSDPSKVIPNVVFEIEGYGIEFGPEEFTTDENGEIDLSKLEPGTYVVTEKMANGYVIDDAQKIIHLEPGQTGEFVFTNSIKPSLRLLKQSTDGTPLGGVTFRISKIEDGTHYLDRTTNDAGEILVSDLEPGVYSVKETATVNDHILDPTEYKVELFPGKTSTLTIQNDKRPNLTIHKRDADTGEVVPGTVFQVRAVDGPWVGEVTTGADGSAKVENLLPGTYEVIEKSVPEPYLLDADSQLVTLYPNRDAEVFFENHKKPSLEIVKIDSVTGDPLKGAKFQIWYASNKTETGELRDLGTYYTDENGVILLEDVEDGWYKVTELEAPDGYAIKDPATQECFIESGGRKVLTFENTPLSALVIRKVDSETGKPLEGAWFRVRYLGGTSGTGGTIVGEYETSVNGTIVLTGMKKGTYVVEEISAPNGYVLDNSTQTVYLTGEDQDVITVTFKNTPKGSLLIQKIDSVTKEPLSDVVFKVTNSDGSVIGNKNGEFTTDSKGTILISDLEPGSTVIVTEVRAKDGYVLDNVPQSIKIKAGETVTLEFRNQPKGQLIIVKKDSVTGKVLKGVTFRITTSTGEYVPDKNGQISSNGLYYTDANGQIILSGLEPGTYVVTEVATIDGYVLNSTPQTVVVNPNDTQTLTFYNDPMGGLQIIKKDEETGERLGGVQFEVRKMNGEIIGTYTTDRYGVIRLPEVEEGWYTVTEVRAPDGYILDDTPQSVEVKDGKTATIELTNRKESNILIHKVDSATGEGLYGATFLLYDKDHRPIGQYTSDQDGYVYIEDGLEDGKYYVREIKAPEGYLLDEELKTFYVKYGQVSEIRWENTAEKGQVQIVKKSKNANSINGLPAGTLLEGAVFEVYDKANNKVDIIVTDQNGRAASKALPLGRYTIREVKAPNYYSINPTTFTAYLEYPGQIVEFEVLDESVGTGVSIQKTGPKEAMSGQPVKYTFSGIGNDSTVPLDNFYWRDTWPAWQVRLQQVVTGTYNQSLYYKIVYKTTHSGSSYRVLADNLSTQRNYAIDASPAALNLAANERVTEIMFVFGTVKAGFRQVEAPSLSGVTIGGLAGGSTFTNVADVGGTYGGEWIMAVTRWVTKVYAKTIIKLPQTGF